MADERVEIEIVLDDGSIKKGFATIKREAKDTGKKVEGSFTKAFTRFEGNLKRTFANIGKSIVAFGGAFASFTALKSVITSATQLETAFAEIKTIIPDVTQANEELRKSLILSSAEFGSTAAAQAKAFYQIISAGITDATAASELLLRANKLAIGGLTDVTTSVDVLTSAVKAFGESELSAAKASDILFTTVRLGKLRVDDLAATLGDVLPTAAALGVSFEEVSGAIAALTTRGLSASAATTQFNAILTAVLKKQAEAIKLGPKVAEAFSLKSLQDKGLTVFLKDLNTSLGGSETLLTKLLGRAEGSKAILSFAKDGFKTLGDNIDQLKDSAGAADAAFKLINQTVAQQLAVAGSRLNAVFLLIGESTDGILAPALEKLNKALEFTIKNLDLVVSTITRSIRAVTALVIALKVVPSVLRFLNAEATIFTTRIALMKLSVQSTGRKFITFGKSLIKVRANLAAAKLSMISFRASIKRMTFKKAILGLKTVGIALGKTKLALKAARVGVNLFKGALTFGLAFAFDFLLEKFFEIKEAFGGLGNLLTFVGLTFRKVFNEMLVSTIEFIQAAKALPGIGKLFKGAFQGTLDEANESLADINKGFDELADKVTAGRFKFTQPLITKEDIVETGALTPELPKLDLTIAKMKAKILTLQDTISSSLKRTIFDVAAFGPEITAPLADLSVTQLAQLQSKLEDFKETSLKTTVAVSSAFKNGLGRGISSGIQSAIKAMQNGQDALSAFANAFIGIMGDLAIQIGTQLIIAGLGLAAMFELNPLGSIAFGAALVALGTIMKGAAGGGGVPGSVPSAEDSVAAPVLETDELTGPAQNVNVKIEGNLIDPQGAAIAIADLLKEEGFNNSVITS